MHPFQRIQVPINTYFLIIRDLFSSKNNNHTYLKTVKVMYNTVTVQIKTLHQFHLQLKHFYDRSIQYFASHNVLVFSGTGNMRQYFSLKNSVTMTLQLSRVPTSGILYSVQCHDDAIVVASAHLWYTVQYSVTMTRQLSRVPTSAILYSVMMTRQLSRVPTSAILYRKYHILHCEVLQEYV